MTKCDGCRLTLNVSIIRLGIPASHPGGFKWLVAAWRATQSSGRRDGRPRFAVMQHVQVRVRIHAGSDVAYLTETMWHHNHACVSSRPATLLGSICFRELNLRA